VIRRHLKTLRLGLMAADVASATAVFLLASIARFGDGESMEIWQGIGLDIRLVAALFGLVWVAALWYRGLYRLRTRWQLRSEVLDILRVTILVAALTLSAVFIFKLDSVSRLFLVILFTVQPLVTLVNRAALRAWFTHLRERGHNTHYMLVVGTGRLARDFADEIESRTGLGIRVIGHLAVPGETPYDLARPILGSIDEIEKVFHTHVVDEVAVCLHPDLLRYRDAVTRVAAEEGKTVRVPIDPIDLPMPNAREEEFDGFVVRSLVFDQGHELSMAVKRAVDITGSLVGLVVLSPLLLATALAIRLRDGPSVLFRQTRVGVHGRQFTICKFRTMVLDAEARYDEVAGLSDTKGAAFKMLHDPRVTPLGAFLRRTSLDELPQLWNVLKGDMSLIGPRPAPPREVVGYDIWHRRRLSMKPGITGLWQVGSRLDAHFDERATLDLKYIDGWSLLLDLKVLLRTIPAVMGGTGK
jgi:exopolysaccharide biosynthesis polyprenyl glycosylphosphotransferase